MLSNNTTYSLPWSPATSSSAAEESGFHDEPEYSNTISTKNHRRSNNSCPDDEGSDNNSNFGDHSPCPDYEEVHEPVVRVSAAARKGLVYNLASENVFPCSPENDKDTITKEKIMQSMIYCIHKVRDDNFHDMISDVEIIINMIT